MAVNLEYEKINYIKEKSELDSQVKVTSKSEISLSEVKKVLTVFPTCQSDNVFIENGRISVSGNISYYVCYIDNENMLKKAEVKGDFSCEIACEKTENLKADVSSCVEKIEIIDTGIKLEIDAIVSVKARCYEIDCVSAVVRGENIIDNQEETSVFKYLGKKQTVTPITEDIELNYEIAEVLNQSAEAVVSSVTCGVGSVIVEGSIILNAILLQTGDKFDIIKESKKLPFKSEIEYSEVTPEMIAEGKAKVKSFRTDISVDQEKKISLVNAEIMLIVETEVYEKSQISIMQDAFSLAREVELKKDSVEISRERRQAVNGDITVKTEITDLPFGGIPKAVTNEKIEVLSQEKAQGILTVTGLITATLLFEIDGEYIAKKVEIPFEKQLQAEVKSNKCKTEVIVLSSRARLLSQSEAEIETEGIFIIKDIESEKVSYISDITEGAEKQAYEHPLSIYIGQKNETKWSLSKRLNISPIELEKTNKELSFPLNGSERIVVYRQRIKENN